MKSPTKNRIALVRAVLLGAMLAMLLWNLVSLGAVAEGREAFVRALRQAPISAEVRYAVGLLLLGASAALELVLVSLGRLELRTPGIARLQLWTSAVVLAYTIAVPLALPIFDGDLRVFYESARRLAGTGRGAGVALVGLGALALYVFQAVERIGLGLRDKLATLVAFTVAAAIFGLGLRALASLASGAPILSG
ncbi:MAG: hypothetical protein GXY23_13795 [Myxococcales bacterium]|nr:hypothetical protein [Myxococcales bacterium]